MNLTNMPLKLYTSVWASTEAVPRVANRDARKYVQRRAPFKGSNTRGARVDTDRYAVYSYDYWPLFVYCTKTKRWYENSERVSVTTSKHRSQLHPLPPEDTIMLTNEEIETLVGLGIAALVERRLDPPKTPGPLAFRGGTMTPNRIKIVFDGGVAEVYGDMMSDMLTCWYNQLHERQKSAHAELSTIRLNDDFRREKFNAACFNYDDAESRMKICDAIERVFKNHSGEHKTFIQEAP